MRHIITSIILLAIISCQNNKTAETPLKNHDFGEFKITTSEKWKPLELKGIDSYVGGLTNGIDTLTFDYGEYSYDFESENLDEQLFAFDTINGKLAVLTKPIKPAQGTIGVYFSNVNDGNKFNLITSDAENETEILSIFQTLTFKDSDTSKNSKITSLKFEKKEISPSGSKYFKVNCAICHSLYYESNLNGPSLFNYNREKFIDWFIGDTIKETKGEYDKIWHQKTYPLTPIELKQLTEFATKL